MNKVINVDKTIEELLKKYGQFVQFLISRKEKRVFGAEYKNEKEADFEKQELKRVYEAHNFLILIIKNPKKYLYSKDDAIYNDSYEYDPKNERLSIYERLLPVTNLVISVGVEDVIYKLSVQIAGHVRSFGYKSDKVWTCYSRNSYDSDARGVLEINKYVNMLGVNDFVRTFKEMIPAQRFAVPMYSKIESR